MRFKKHVPWLFLLLVFYSARAVTPVLAHALLVRSSPAANAVLDQPPVQVELFFSEPVEPQLSSIAVLDSSSQRVDVGDVRVDPADPVRLTVSLRSLSDGVYTVTWKVVSTVDGHQSTGTFPFAVGNANAAALSSVPQSTSFRLPVSALIARLLMMASLALLAGRSFFTAFIWSPVLKRSQNETDSVRGEPGVWNRLYRAGLIGLLLSIGSGILAQAGQSTGAELGLPWSLETGRMLIETRLGLIWLARLGLAMLAVWLSARKPYVLREWGGFIVSLVLLLTLTLTSHAATEARPFFPILADWIHLIGMTFWLGGIAYLFTGVRHLRLLNVWLRTRLTSLLMRRFSNHALVVVALIGLTGIYSAVQRVGAWSTLFTSLYGQALLVKQLFVAGLLAVAATNFLIISPRLNRERLQGTANPRLVSRFARLLIADLVFAGLLLASVSFLTYIPPAKLPAPVTTEFTYSQRVDDLSMQLDISPARVGQNEFMLMLFSSDGQPVARAKEVLLRFTPSRGSVPPSELQLVGDGSGMYMAQGSYLSLPGKWQVQAVVRRPDKFDVYANFDLTLQTPGRSSEAASLPRQTGGLIIGLGILSILFTLSFPVQRALRWGVGIPVTLLLVALGLLTLARPLPSGSIQANPIPPNRDSVAAGQALYTTHCASCHGAAGKGDGPVGVTLNPRPADLSQHAIPGVHSDAQLFEWITDGFPGSRMPAFKTALSDTDRWNLVNFIRTLAPE